MYTYKFNKYMCTHLIGMSNDIGVHICYNVTTVNKNTLHHYKF